MLIGLKFLYTLFVKKKISNVLHVRAHMFPPEIGLLQEEYIHVRIKKCHLYRIVVNAEKKRKTKQTKKHSFP